LPVLANQTYGYNYEPTSHLDMLPDHKHHGLHVHLWQIFTAMTLILTVASSLIYFNSIVPQNKNAEFIAITKSKTTFYNQQEYIKTFFEDHYSKNLIGYQLSASCYTDINEVDPENEAIETNLQELNEQQRYIDALKNDYSQKGIQGEYNALLDSYADSVQSYLTEVVLIFEKQNVYREKTLAIQKEASGICSSEIEGIQDRIDTFQRLNNDFPLESLETMDDWIDKNKAWRESTNQLVETINSDNYSPELIAGQLEEFREGFVEIFAVAFDYDTYQQRIESLYIEALNALRKVEEFEKAYIQNNRQVEGNTVFVTLKNESSED